MNEKNFKFNILGIIGGVILAIGTFLPYLTSKSGGSSSLMDYDDGVIFLGIGLAIFITSLNNIKAVTYRKMSLHNFKLY